MTKRLNKKREEAERWLAHHRSLEGLARELGVEDPDGTAISVANENPEAKRLINSLRLQTDWGGYGILAPEI